MRLSYIIGGGAVLGIAIGAILHFTVPQTSKVFLGDADTQKAASPAAGRGTDRFSLIDAVATVSVAPAGTPAFATEICKASLYLKAYRDVDSHLADELSYQTKVIECARQNGIDNYESLLSSNLPPDDNLGKRIEALACAREAADPGTVFEKKRSEYTTLFKDCLAQAQENAIPDPVPLPSGAVSSEEHAYNCQQIAVSFGSYSNLVNCYEGSSLDNPKNSLDCVDPFRLKKFKNISLSEKALALIADAQKNNDIFQSDRILKGCLLRENHLNEAFSQWSKQAFQDNEMVDY